MTEYEQDTARSSPARVKTILLVEDGDDCRVTTKWFLTNFGYAVDAGRRAEEALALFDPAIHNLVVTDNAMPGMSGAEMAHVIKLRSPSTPVLTYSGQPPEDRSCLDLVVQRPTHLLTLKDAADRLLAAEKYTVREEDGFPVVRPPPCSDVYLIGRAFQWYPLIELEKGKQYRLHLSSTDVPHGFSLQPVNINISVHPNYDHVLTITPTTVGEHGIVCNEYCGLGHHVMAGKIYVTEQGAGQ